MLSPHKISQIIRISDAQFEQDADFLTTRRSFKLNASTTEAAPIVSYLLHPYENGYWELKAKWNTMSRFSMHLLKDLGTIEEIEKEGDMTKYSPTLATRKIPSHLRSELVLATNRVSTIGDIFSATLKNNKEEDYEGGINPRAIKNRVNYEIIAEEFEEALAIFESKIYCEGMINDINAELPLYRIKSGIVSFLEMPKRRGELHIAGTQRSDILALKEFYESLGCLESPAINRVFSPDEALFKPYFPFVSGVLPHVIKDGQIYKIFSQALDYYKEEDYQHCISTLGLIAEDYLQRIYTSLLREQVASNLTIGQTLDQIHKKIDAIFPNNKSTHKPIENAYEKINSINDGASVEELKSMLRDIVTLIKDDRIHYGKRFDEITKPQVRRTPFPPNITDSLNELLKWRNAASHNSRIPLGEHEADRTLYCLIGFITWWQDQLNKIDWSKSKLDIVEELLQLSKIR